MVAIFSELAGGGALLLGKCRGHGALLCGLGGRGSLLHGRGGGSGGRQHSDWPVGSDAPAGRWAAALWLTGGRVRALHVLAVAR